MKNLLKLREWLTLPEAARHLSMLLAEEVTESDLLRYSLDGHLTLSVNFVNHATGRCGRIVSVDEAKATQLRSPNGEAIITFDGPVIGENEVAELSSEVVSIDGVWDLSMWGVESLDVEHLFQQLTGGPSIELTNLEGPLVKRSDGTVCLLLEHFSRNEFAKPENLKKPYGHPDNYYPASGLPSDSVLVVRTSALRDFENRVAEAKPDNPLAKRERTTLLVVIAALSRLAKIDLSKPSSAAQAIESETTRMGARVAARTIEEHLKRIPGALEDRGTE